MNTIIDTKDTNEVSTHIIDESHLIYCKRIVASLSTMKRMIDNGRIDVVSALINSVRLDADFMLDDMECMHNNRKT